VIFILSAPFTVVSAALRILFKKARADNIRPYSMSFSVLSFNVARVQRHAAKKNAGHNALLVLDKQIKINMCRTKERRQQNEC
jgi:hypothetical protein